MRLHEDGKLATQEATFVDHIHPSCHEQEDDDKVSQACWSLNSRMNLVGNYAADHTQVCRPQFLWPCAWNGSIIHTDTTFSMTLAIKTEWDKFKSGLRWIWGTEAESCMLETTKLRKPSLPSH